MFVSQKHGLSIEVLDEYLQETKLMCVNNPASTDGWNLITYGARLLDSQSPGDCLSGGRVLTMLIDQNIPVPIPWLLIRSPGQRIQRLIGTLAWRSPAEREMRWFAARIVEHLAGHLNLAQFPGALECISSLFDTSRHNNGEQEVLHLPFVIGRSKSTKRKGFLATLILEQDNKQKENGERIDEDLVFQGLRILANLAHDKHNCTLIYNTKDLLSRVVAPVSSNKLVKDFKSNAEWTKVVDGSLEVVSRLMGSSGSTGKKMSSLIANNSNAVKNLEAILDMDMKSNVGIIELQMRALEVLTQLALHHLASASSMMRREELIERALHIFLTADWMEDYLKDEKKKIDKPTPSPKKTSPRPSWRPSIDNLIKKVKEKRAKQAREARAEKKMKEAQQTASRLKEKAGEALAMLSSDSEAIKIAMMSSDSEAIKSFTGCEDNVHRLTELLSSEIKTIKCKISATDHVEIEISTACRISAAVLLKNLSNHIKEPTISKVLEVLLSLQAEVSSTTTPTCGEHVSGCNAETRYDIENPSDGGQDKPSALRKRSHIQQCEDRRLQAELLSLFTAIRASGHVNLAEILISQPVTLEDFVARLKKMVEDNMLVTPACLAIQKLICKMGTELIPHDRNVEVIEKHDIVGALLKASKTMARLESSMLFGGVDRDCHGVDLGPLFSDLAKEAEDVLTRRKQELDIDAPPANVP